MPATVVARDAIFDLLMPRKIRMPMRPKQSEPDDGQQDRPIGTSLFFYLLSGGYFATVVYYGSRGSIWQMLIFKYRTTTARVFGYDSRNCKRPTDKYLIRENGDGEDDVNVCACCNITLT